MKENDCIVDIIEIDEERCEGLKSLEWLNRVIHGDVRGVDELVETNYDMVLWSHGPEMLERKDIVPTINKLLGITKKLIILMAPWGNSPYRHNKTPLYEEDLRRLGFKTSTLGVKDERESNLLAWKKV